MSQRSRRQNSKWYPWVKDTYEQMTSNIGFGTAPGSTLNLMHYRIIESSMVFTLT